MGERADAHRGVDRSASAACRWLRSLLAVGLLAAFAAFAAFAAAACPPAMASSLDRAVTYQLDSQHDGDLTSTITTPLSHLWTDTLAGPSSYPLIVNGVVYVTTGGNGGSSTLNALDLATGTTLWSHGLGSGLFSSSPPAYDNGEIFVVSSGALDAIDADTGTPIWSVPLLNQNFFTAPPTAAGGTVYVVGSGEGATLYAVSEPTGTLLWMKQLQSGGASPAVDAQDVYVTSSVGLDYAFDRLTGALTWSYIGSSQGGQGLTPVLAGGYLLTRDAAAGNEVLSAATGVPAGPFSAGPAPAVGNGMAYAVQGGQLTAISGDGLGTNTWTFSGDGHLVTAPLLVGNLVFVGSSSGTLYAVDGSGHLAWSTNVGSPMTVGEAQLASYPTSGLGAAEDAVVLPAGNTVVAYAGGEVGSGPPSNTAPPTILGRPAIGQRMTVDVGAWTSLPSAYSYQWKRCTSAGTACLPISAAQGQSYTPTDADLGSSLVVTVGASNASGPSVAVDSAPSPVVAQAPPTDTALPSITGTLYAGGQASVAPGSWTGSPTQYLYQWERCPQSFQPCQVIAGAIDSTYAPTDADLGSTLTVAVTAVNDGGDSLPASSAQTGYIGGPPPLTNLSPPTISGSREQGQTLTASPGTWANDPFQPKFTYQWLYCDQGSCTDEPNATGDTYVVDPSDIGFQIELQVTQSDPFGTSKPATSAPTTPIDTLGPTNVTPPTVTGNPQVTGTLTVAVGNWTGNPTSYQFTWLACDATETNCADIPGATSQTYAAQATDQGQYLAVGVYAINTLGYSQFTVSAPVGPVGAAPAAATTTSTATASTKTTIATTTTTATTSTPAARGAVKSSTTTLATLGLSLGATPRLAALLRHGLTVVLHCVNACRATLTLQSLPSQRGLPSILGSITVRLRAGQRHTIVLQLARGVASKLHRLAPLHLRLAATVTEQGASRRVVRSLIIAR